MCDSGWLPDTFLSFHLLIGLNVPSLSHLTAPEHQQYLWAFMLLIGQAVDHWYTLFYNRFSKKLARRNLSNADAIRVDWGLSWLLFVVLSFQKQYIWNINSSMTIKDVFIYVVFSIQTCVAGQFRIVLHWQWHRLQWIDTVCHIVIQIFTAARH